jgi:hypothetical protein
MLGSSMPRRCDVVEVLLLGVMQVQLVRCAAVAVAVAMGRREGRPSNG